MDRLTLPVFNHLCPAEDSEVRMVDLTGASWNQIAGWLRQLDLIRAAA